MMYLAGIDIGGTKTSLVVGSEEGKIIEKCVFLTEERKGPEDFIERTLKELENLYEKFPFKKIGIACGSPLDPEKGIIDAPPNLPSFKSFPIVKRLKKTFAIPIGLENDANACALAEYEFGAGRGSSNMVFITFGTGCGAGIIINGSIYRGSSNFAGEIGHIRLEDDGPEAYGKKGSMESFCSGSGILRLYCEECKRASVTPVWTSAKEIGEAASGGDPLALRIFEISGAKLGKGLSLILDLINPDLIVIGSIFARCENILRPPMERVIESEALSYTRNACRIVKSELGDLLGDYAALGVAKSLKQNE